MTHAVEQAVVSKPLGHGLGPAQCRPSLGSWAVDVGLKAECSNTKAHQSSITGMLGGQTYGAKGLGAPFHAPETPCATMFAPEGGKGRLGWIGRNGVVVVERPLEP